MEGKVISIRLAADLIERLDRFTSNRSATIARALEEHMGSKPTESARPQIERVSGPKPKTIPEACPSCGSIGGVHMKGCKR